MGEKKLSEAIAYRRSVRVYDKQKDLDTSLVKKCIEQAVLAPNSSNLQLWEFYHIISESMRKKISRACLNQTATRTAQQYVVVVVRKDLWKKRALANLAFENSKDKRKIDKKIITYYSKIIPTLYTDVWGIYGFIKRIITFFRGLRKPSYRQVTREDLNIIAHKSSALAAQNFMLSMAAQGYDTCPMEGFDSLRVKKYLNLPAYVMINMVISCGVRAEEGVKGARFRVPFKEVYFEK